MQTERSAAFFFVCKNVLFLLFFLYISTFFYIDISTFLLTLVPFWTTALVLRILFIDLNFSSEIKNCCSGAVLEYRTAALELFNLNIDISLHIYVCTGFVYFKY